MSWQTGLYGGQVACKGMERTIAQREEWEKDIIGH